MGRHLAVLLLDAAHHHAEVLRLDDDADAFCASLGHHRVRDLLGHALLYLKPPRVHVDYARELRDAKHLALGYVADRALAVERQHVVLAERVELDVLQDHHVVRARLEPRAVHDLGDVLPVAARQERKRPRDPLGGLLESVACGVLAKLDEELLHELRDLRLVRRLCCPLLHGAVLYHIPGRRTTIVEFALEPARRFHSFSMARYSAGSIVSR